MSYDLEILLALHEFETPNLVTVWALEDRNFDEAAKKCSILIEEGPLCINW